jgi:uncharacterized membrane protein
MQNLSIEIQSIIVFFSEIVFLYLKTINIQAISKDKVLPAILSNSAVSITWLIGVTISINSLLNNHYLPILCFLAGGVIGTYLAMTRQKRKVNIVELKKTALDSLRIF